MNFQHKELAAGRWNKLSFAEQMANVGSEVERTINWLSRNNKEYADKSFARALELLDLTIEHNRARPGLRELVRLRAVLADYFSGANFYKSTDDSLKKYFTCFFFAARRGK